jgi:hypothetical protein
MKAGTSIDNHEATSNCYITLHRKMADVISLESVAEVRAEELFRLDYQRTQKTIQVKEQPAEPQTTAPGTKQREQNPNKPEERRSQRIAKRQQATCSTGCCISLLALLLAAGQAQPLQEGGQAAPTDPPGNVTKSAITGMFFLQNSQFQNFPETLNPSVSNPNSLIKPNHPGAAQSSKLPNTTEPKLRPPSRDCERYLWALTSPFYKFQLLLLDAAHAIGITTNWNSEIFNESLRRLHEPCKP